MINRLISLALTQRAFVVILALALVGFGLFSLANLPIQAFPDVQDVQVRVISLYPGQAPQDWNGPSPCPSNGDWPAYRT